MKTTFSEPSPEEKIFGRKRFDAGKMLRFGFRAAEGGFVYSSDFFNGDFRAEITVSASGGVSGKVIDKMNDEEYAPLRIDGFNCGYVNSVRNGYEELLSYIAENCCRGVLFACDQANRVTELISRAYSVDPDFPFGQGQYGGCGVFRHGDNRKWFAIIMNVRRSVLDKRGGDRPVDIINLKTDPGLDGGSPAKEGVYPAYHMNHKKWISVLLDDTLSDGDIMAMIDISFRMTKQRPAVRN